MFRALERVQQRMFPGAITLPSMLSGATDMAQLRAHGVQAYGFGPIIDETNGGGCCAHADDERPAEAAPQKMGGILWATVPEITRAPKLTPQTPSPPYPHTSLLF